MAIYKRAWRLSIQINNIVKTFQELDYKGQSLKIEFDINNAVYGGFASGNITIYNLAQSDMEFLSSSVSPYGKFKRNKISLEAGYVGNIALILSGNIIGVECDYSSVDNKITLSVQGGIQNNLLNNSIQTSLKGKVDFKTICSECAKHNGLILKYDKNITKRNLSDYSFLGSPFQMIENLKKFFSDLNIFIDETGKVLNVLLTEKGEKINEQELSSDTGLIGKPKPTLQGCNVLSMLNTNFKAGGFVKLKNESLKSLDGVYRITELKHKGSNFGDLWASELVLFKSKG
ncbi:baseplate hub protein [Campylobacter lanienae]|uniref:baseplate hub protein n=1 Tax=Campylobacter lanienae TaxID=75658 RepID=UPI00242D7D6C|nr:hypothetical protein [Campylobacter lanienae]MDD5786035.1 hypothetical protein [Campylobacter lanienae]